MFGPFASLPFLFAQAAAAAPAPAGEPATSPLMQLVPFLAVLPIFYFLLIRPQQQQDRKRKEMINQIKKNDKVLTAAGFYATVVSIDPDGDRIVLKIDEEGKVRVAFARSGIVRVVNEATDKGNDRK